MSNDPAVGLEVLRGDMDRKLTALEGQIKTLQTSIQLGLQGIREQFAGFIAALSRQDGDCTKCKAGLDHQLGDHEKRLRDLEEAKWKLIGALLLLGPLMGGLGGTIVDWIFKGIGK